MGNRNSRSRNPIGKNKNKKDSKRTAENDKIDELPKLNPEPEPESRHNPPRPLTPPRDENPIFVAIYRHDKEDSSDLAFEIGARFEVSDKQNKDWWWSKDLQTGESGYIPSSLVVHATSLFLQDWFFGDVDRKEAERCLTRDPRIRDGTFLVRTTISKKTSDSKHKFSLSIKRRDEQQRIYTNHHRIFQDDDDNYYLFTNISFRTLHDLVNYYVEQKLPALLLNGSCPKLPPPVTPPNTIDKWEIDRETLQYTQRLGEGNFGEVWHGYWNGRYEVAVKTLKPGTMSVEAFLEEAKIMKTLQHDNILALYAVCSIEQPILIVTEYMNGGSLLEVLKKHDQTLEFVELIEICAQVSNGMHYIENLGLIHRDLAARNILMDKQKPCKIADFGLARAVAGGIYSPNPKNSFPMRWTAPEVITESQYSIRSDVWAFGIVMMEVMTFGANPYPGYDNQQVAKRVPEGLIMAKPQMCPDTLYDIMRKCWNLDPEERPTFDFLSTYLFDFPIVGEGEYQDPNFQNRQF